MANTNDFRPGRHCIFTLHVHLVCVTKYRRGVFTEAAHETLREIFTKVHQDFEAILVDTMAKMTMCIYSSKSAESGVVKPG